uniref:Uncharacterized protein n=1 Tax=Globodera rostochiensis TaxID=31243 RepID=A0A914H958_GLORO
MCAATRHGSNTTSYHAHVEIYQRLTRGIAECMHTWLNSELESIWPDVTLSHVTKALGTEDIKESNYQRVAELIQYEANQRGNSSYFHQVVVAPDWERERFFFHEGKRNEIATIFGKRGVHVVITRYNREEAGFFERLTDCDKWIEKNRSVVEDHLKNQLSALGGNAKLSDIVHGVSVDFKYEFMVGEYHWHHMVLLHNRKWLSLDCNIHVGIAGETIRGTRAYDGGTHVFVTSIFAMANRYQMILMI